MSKYGDMVALLEWAMKQKNPKTPRPRKNKEPINLDDLDLAEIYVKLEAREAKIKAAKSNIEKMMKKEDKKADKVEFISAPRLAFLLMASFPITAPLYVFWLQNMLRAAGWK